MDEGASFEFVYTFKNQGWAGHLVGILLWIGTILTISEMNVYYGTGEASVGSPRTVGPYLHNCQ